jgi:serine/threonine-protein kinase
LSEESSVSSDESSGRHANDETVVELESEHIGRYELCYEVAAGGMAMVYLARSAGPHGVDRIVALKTIHRHLARERSFIDMFLDEAKIASRIAHPNVCAVHDFGEADGQYFIAMEFLVGEPLIRLIKRLAKLPELREQHELPLVMGHIVAEAAEGLHAAHELADAEGRPLGVVHRDVSPQNLFITYDGAVKVVDFGIASAASKMHHTRTGEVKGKFAYMAPEQLSMDRQADRRTDVWALGVVLWEALTSRRLFRRNTDALTLSAVLEDDVVPPSRLSPRVPPTLDRVVLRALTRDPRERFQTTREMASALRQALVGRGAAIGPADVAAWMDRLFPDGRHNKQALVRAAEQRKRVPVVLSAPTTDSNISTIERAEPRRGARLFLLGMVLVAVVGLTGAAFYAGRTSSADSDTTSPPTPAMPPSRAVPAPSSGTRAEAVPDRETRPPETVDASVAEAPPAEPSAPMTHGSRRRTPRMRPSTMVAAATATGTGTLAVVTPGGWADVYDEQGAHLGQTPLRVSTMAGRRRVVLRPFGGTERVVRSVDVPAEGTGRLSLPLSGP